VCVFVADRGSERYRTRSSGGFEPIVEEKVTTASDPYIARAQAGAHRETPPSDRGSQVAANSNWDTMFVFRL